MCMISFFPEGVQPDESCLTNGTTYNDDGHGYAILHDGRFLTGHFVGKSAARDAIAEFVRMRKQFPKGPAMFHSRLTTHGETSLDNCHPFFIGGENGINGHKDTMIAHNGILPSFSQPAQNDPRSDTRVFAEDVVPLLGDHFNIWSKRGRKRIEDWMGRFNKIVMITTRPYVGNRWHILNEKEGIWHGGIWYSNSSFRDVRYYRYSFGSSQGIQTRYPYEYESGSSVYPDWRDETASPVTKCNACFSYGTVDRNTAFCSFCGMCNDCSEMAEICLCYVPAKLDKPADESQVTTCREFAPIGWPSEERTIEDINTTLNETE